MLNIKTLLVGAWYGVCIGLLAWAVLSWADIVTANMSLGVVNNWNVFKVLFM